ncbi:MAG TPA: sigma-70 family RNA polymerase sigma factor [Phycisphaerae bacterium]|nr:sigma-70 family RNA polymerase sigma factor [Phycisphaerae bacterium]HNU45342.1 sigma-70 family RNA polymerase sigma factor [Phycisphaerae bacterium]
MVGVAGITDQHVERAAGGSQQDVSQVVEAMLPQIRLMVVARLAPKPAQFHLIDDVVQEVSSALAVGLGGLRARTLDGLRAFLSGITARQVARLLADPGGRGPAGRPLQSLDSTINSSSNAGPLWEFLSSSGTSPISAADRADRAARLLSELGRLKDRHREVITLAFFDQLALAEIGARMGLSRNAASVLLLRAVGTLRRRMTGVA